MNKLKEIWGWIIAAITAVFGVVVYMLMRKGEEVNALKAKVALAKTEKEADLIEVEIKQLRENKDNIAKQNRELDTTLKQVDEKRKQITEDTKKMTDPKEIASYWNNN